MTMMNDYEVFFDIMPMAQPPFRSGFSLCLHVAKISFLSLSVAPSGRKTITNFSFKHNLQVFVVGLKTGAFEIICQEILNGALLFFSFQM